METPRKFITAVINAVINAVISIGNHALLLVQLGINSTSDVWKFCQNWTSRRGEFPNITSTINP